MQLKNILSLAVMLAWQDLRQSYRRSAIGPFWLTLAMAVQIVTIGLVFGLIFRAETDEYIPFLAASLILWGLIANTITEGCRTFIDAEILIRQLPLPKVVHVARSVLRNLLTAAHNIVILPIVFFFFSKAPSISLTLFLPGLVVLILNLAWVVALLGLLSARFRDVPPIVASMLTVAFYVTPVMWLPTLLGDGQLAHLLLGLNPLYHWLQIVRLPTLGLWPTLDNWAVALLTAGVGWLVTLFAYKRFSKMIAYWV